MKTALYNGQWGLFETIIASKMWKCFLPKHSITRNWEIPLRQEQEKNHDCLYFFIAFYSN